MNWKQIAVGKKSFFFGELLNYVFFSGISFPSRAFPLPFPNHNAWRSTYSEKAQHTEPKKHVEEWKKKLDENFSNKVPHSPAAFHPPKI